MSYHSISTCALLLLSSSSAFAVPTYQTFIGGLPEEAAFIAQMNSMSMNIGKIDFETAPDGSAVAGGDPYPPSNTNGTGFLTYATGLPTSVTFESDIAQGFTAYSGFRGNNLGPKEDEVGSIRAVLGLGSPSGVSAVGVWLPNIILNWSLRFYISDGSIIDFFEEAEEEENQYLGDRFVGMVVHDASIDRLISGSAFNSYMDDFYVGAVPMPGTASLGFMALLIFVRRRRPMSAQIIRGGSPHGTPQS